MSNETCPKSIAMALVKAQAAVKAVEKDSTNSFHKYKYASSDDMVAEARRAMTGAGLACSRIGWTEQPVTEHAPARLLVHYMLTSVEGECMFLPPVSVPVLPEKGRPEDKAEAAALTYSHGYLVLGLLQMARVDEGSPDQRDDREREPHRQQQRQQTQQRAPEPARQSAPTQAVLPDVIDKNIDLVKSGEALLTWCKTWGQAAAKAQGHARASGNVREAAKRLGVDALVALEWAGLHYDPSSGEVSPDQEP